MGILDDAIREHLDLKRRLGAEDDELKRLEDEAFGPPTRPGDPDFPQQAAGETAAATAEAEAPGDYAGEADLFADAPDASSTSAPLPEPVSDELAIEPEPESAEHPVEPASEEHVAEPGEPEPDALQQPITEDRPIETLDTVEHRFEDAIDETGESEPVDEVEVVEGEIEKEEEGTGDEDVLEETPEFLRDQPEDDELWFEQGEPKDFDF
jgi:hypothetical protein